MNPAEAPLSTRVEVAVIIIGDSFQATQRFLGFPGGFSYFFRLHE
jgi:hypothetical protein